MSLPRVIYLALTLSGLILPWYYNLQYMTETSGAFDIVDFMAAAASTSAGQSLGWDLAIACIAGLIWMFLESRKLGMRFFWIYPVLTFSIAYAFAFPLFLFFRQGILEARQERESNA